MVSRPAVLGPVSPVEPVTPEELLAHMQQGSHGTTQTVQSTEITAALSSAIGYVQGKCGPILATDMRVAARHDGRRGTLILPTPAITDLAELITPDGVDVVASVDADDVDWSAAIIRLPRMDAGEWVARVRTVSSAERTASLKLATLIIGAHLAAARLVSVPGVQAGGPGFAIPRRADDLLAAWRLVAVA